MVYSGTNTSCVAHKFLHACDLEAGGPAQTSFSLTRSSARSCTRVGAVRSTNTDWVENGLGEALRRRT